MDIVVRITIVYALLTLGFRTLGKRQLSQLSPFELITLLLIAEIVAPALTAGDHSVTAAVFGAATLLCLTFGQSVLSYASKRFRRVEEAAPSLLVRHGRLVEETMHKDRIRPDEVLSEMHKAGLERLSQVKWGFIEPDGKLTFIRYDGEDTSEPDPKAAV